MEIYVVVCSRQCFSSNSGLRLVCCPCGEQSAEASLNLTVSEPGNTQGAW